MVCQIIKSGKDNTKFTYDGQDVVLDNNDGVITKYQNGLGIDNKLKLTTNGTSKYFLQDHLGSTTGLTNSLGSLVESTTYDAFGNATGDLITRYSYTGREYDSFTGMYYYRARWYSSELGRFISEDPIGFAGGDVNLFGYVHNNSINKNDPLGLLDKNDFPEAEINRRKSQCNAVRELLRREKDYGTGPAAWISSVTFGDEGTALYDLNNRQNGNLSVGGKDFDLDWYIDSHAVSGVFSQFLGPSAYVGGKFLWAGRNLITGDPQTYYLPWEDPGELEASIAISGGKGFRDIFDENWFKEYCPCEEE
jgi:RHS repeat-associated protein